MNALAVAVLLSAGATGRVEVLLSRSIDTAPERAQDVIERVVQALRRADVPVGDPKAALAKLAEAKAGTPEACAARRPCLAKLGVTLDARVVVGVDVGHVGDQMAVGLEAVNPTDATRLAQERFTVPTAAYPAGVDVEIGRFIDALNKVAPTLKDAPLASGLLTPADGPPPPPPVVIATPSKPLPMPALATTGGAVVLAATAVVFGVLGSSAMGKLSDARYTSGSTQASRLTRPEADALVSTANTDFTVAAGTGAGAVLVGALSGWLWTRAGDAP